MIPQLFTEIPIIGNRWAVGAVFQIHLVVVAAIIGIGLIAPAAEMVGQRRGGYWEQLSRHLASIMVHFFAWGATFAAFALILVAVLYPVALGVLASIFFWPLVVVGFVWVVMTLSVYIYHESWERLADRPVLHVAIGWVFALATVLFISLIIFLSSYQLTPTNPTSLGAAIFNPSWISELIHRHIGNLSYGGFLLAGYAGFVTLYFLKGDGERRSYYDWIGHLGIVVGLGLALAQPFAGWFYAYRVQLGSPGAFNRIMVGADAWLFLIQMLFFGGVLVLANLYMLLAAARGDGPSAWLRGAFWAVVAFAILGIIPSSWPLGSMTPWKYIALGGLFVLSLVNLILYLRASRRFVWGRAPRSASLALVAAGLVIVALLANMGIIRTSARGGDPIYGVLPSGQSQEIR